MNKLRILSVVCMTMAFTLITSGYSMMFLDSYKVDASEKSYYSSMIKTSFNSYIQDTKDISYNIKNTNMFNSKYYVEIKNSHSTSIAELNEIELNVKNISVTSEALLYECKIRNYNDYEIDYKCDTIKHNYESLVNAYVSIYNKYNDKIDLYNDWITKQNSNNYIEKYQSNYFREYVDINEDGVYSGVIE